MQRAHICWIHLSKAAGRHIVIAQCTYSVPSILCSCSFQSYHEQLLHGLSDIS